MFRRNHKRCFAAGTFNFEREQQSAIYHSILSPFTWKTLIDLAQRQNNKMIDKSPTYECWSTGPHARLTTWNEMRWDVCEANNRMATGWAKRKTFAVTAWTRAEANLARTKVEKIINLRIIYCGLEFMVHSSFCSGMNRKHSFITIFGTQHVFQSKDQNEENAIARHSMVWHGMALHWIKQHTYIPSHTPHTQFTIFTHLHIHIYIEWRTSLNHV